MNPFLAQIHNSQKKMDCMGIRDNAFLNNLKVNEISSTLGKYSSFLSDLRCVTIL
jgi:hypothetical protein